MPSTAASGTGAITIRHLVINSLRMRPDRIIVGEVRAEEALDMLQAMNTGHDGSLTTLHANTPRDGLGRLEVMVGMANANMGIRSIRSQIASAVDLFVQTSRFTDGTRRITRITQGFFWMFGIASFRAGFLGMRSSSIAYSKDAFK